MTSYRFKKGAIKNIFALHVDTQRFKDVEEIFLFGKGEVTLDATKNYLLGDDVSHPVLVNMGRFICAYKRCSDELTIHTVDCVYFVTTSKKKYDEKVENISYVNNEYS